MKKKQKNKECAENFTLIRVRVSTKKRLKTACPKGMQFQFFTSDFIENALDHRDVLGRVAESSR